mmetsp:Transcript_56937/g.135434  ORF Transcript_56937/g.135434 Transcript_56937/m.135434 type:complete len:1347 (+) Transcript_56937:51-4091(+)
MAKKKKQGRVKGPVSKTLAWELARCVHAMGGRPFTHTEMELFLRRHPQAGFTHNQVCSFCAKSHIGLHFQGQTGKYVIQLTSKCRARLQQYQGYHANYAAPSSWRQGYASAAAPRAQSQKKPPKPPPRSQQKQLTPKEHASLLASFIAKRPGATLRARDVHEFLEAHPHTYRSSFGGSLLSFCRQHPRYIQVEFDAAMELIMKPAPGFTPGHPRPADSDGDSDTESESESDSDEVESGGPSHHGAHTTIGLTKVLAVDGMRWCHDSIKYCFRDGRLLVKTLQELMEGKIEPQVLPPFDVVFWEGLWYAVTGNRRLWVLREYQRLSGKPVVARVRHVSSELSWVWWRWTTRVSGRAVEIRLKGNRRGGMESVLRARKHSFHSPSDRAALSFYFMMCKEQPEEEFPEEDEEEWSEWPSDQYYEWEDEDWEEEEEEEEEGDDESEEEEDVEEQAGNQEEEEAKDEDEGKEGEEEEQHGLGEEEDEDAEDVQAKKEDKDSASSMPEPESVLSSMSQLQPVAPAQPSLAAQDADPAGEETRMEKSLASKPLAVKLRAKHCNVFRKGPTSAIVTFKADHDRDGLAAKLASSQGSSMVVDAVKVGLEMLPTPNPYSKTQALSLQWTPVRHLQGQAQSLSMASLATFIDSLCEKVLCAAESPPGEVVGNAPQALAQPCLAPAPQQRPWQLSPEWWMQYAPSGHPYYYNSATKETTWTAPNLQSQRPPPHQPQCTQQPPPPPPPQYLAPRPDAHHALCLATDSVTEPIPIALHQSIIKDQPPAKMPPQSIQNCTSSASSAQSSVPRQSNPCTQPMAAFQQDLRDCGMWLHASAVSPAYCGSAMTWPGCPPAVPGAGAPVAHSDTTLAAQPCSVAPVRPLAQVAHSAASARAPVSSVRQLLPATLQAPPTAVPTSSSGLPAAAPTAEEAKPSVPCSVAQPQDQRASIAASQSRALRDVLADGEVLAAALPSWLWNSLADAFARSELAPWRLVLDVGRPPVAHGLRAPGATQQLPLECQQAVRPDDLAELLGTMSQDAPHEPCLRYIGRSVHKVGIMQVAMGGGGSSESRDSAIAGVTLKLQHRVAGVSRVVADVLAGSANSSFALVGPARSGRTAMLRDIAIVMAKSRSVLVLDTAGELGGGPTCESAHLGECRRCYVGPAQLTASLIASMAATHWPDVVVVDQLPLSQARHALHGARSAGARLICTIAEPMDLEASSDGQVLGPFDGCIELSRSQFGCCRILHQNECSSELRCGLQGVWHQQGHKDVLCTIDAELKVTWVLDGFTSQLFASDGSNCVTLDMDGVKYEGQLSPRQGLIRWSDGDEWHHSERAEPQLMPEAPSEALRDGADDSIDNT